jgi:hypothetical protein
MATSSIGMAGVGRGRVEPLDGQARKKIPASQQLLKERLENGA